MKKVVTTNGTQHWGPFSEKEPHTDEQAEALCKSANARAEDLGIQTRYEVKDS